MKKIILTLFAMIICVALKAQTLYEVKYYDIDDKETYKGLFFYTDDDNCFLRCVTKPDNKGRYSYWERSYTCGFEKEDGVKYLYFVPEQNKRRDEPIIPAFCMAYSDKGEFETTTWAIFQNLEDDEILDENMQEVDYFREVSLRDKDEEYFQQFYDEDEPMYKQIMSARALLLGQGSTENTVQSDPNAPTTMHFIVVAATQDATIGPSVETDLKLVRKDFSAIAEKLGIAYKETIISGNSFKKSAIENAVNKLAPNANDIVVFIYSGHGFRYDDDTDAYPRMYLTYGDDLSAKTELSTTELYNKIVDKKARLTIFLTDCCNSKVGFARAEVESIAFGTRGATNNTDINKLRALFIDESGTVRATAAKAGQYALCDASGGFMLTSILNNIRAQTNALSQTTPSWNAIVENASKAVAKKTSNQIDEAGNVQDPQVVVRSVKVKGIDQSGRTSTLSGDYTESSNESESLETKSTSSSDDDGLIDFVVDAMCVIIPILIIIFLIVIIIKKMKKK